MLASASSSKPGTTPLVSLAQLNASASAANLVTRKLTKNNPMMGLLYYVPEGEDAGSSSLPLNAWAVWLAEQVQQSTLQGLAFSGSVKTAAASWKAAAEETLVKRAKDARKPDHDESWYSYAPDNKPLLM
jgi:hypothetical protein